MPSPSTGELGTANSEAGLLVPMFGAGGHKYAQVLSGQLSFAGAIINAITHIFQQVSVSLYRAVFRAIQGWSDYPIVVKGDGPIGYWRLGDPVGAVTAFDSSGFLNLGTLHGGITVSQTGGLNDSSSSMLFNGSTGYISTLTNLNKKTTFSLECLAYPTGTPSSTITPYEMIAQELVVKYRINNNLGIEVLTSSNGTSWSVFGQVGANNTITVNAWNHCVLTCDSITLRVYVNGVQIGTQTATGNVGGSNSNNILIGWHGVVGQNEFFQGRLEEIAIYPFALTAQQVKTHYSAVTPFPPAGMFTVIRTIQ